MLLVVVIANYSLSGRYAETLIGLDLTGSDLIGSVPIGLVLIGQEILDYKHMFKGPK